MSEKFQFPLPLFNVQGGTFGQQVDIWKPIAFTKNDLESRGSRSYGIVGRLKPGVSLSQAQAEVDTIIAGWLPRFPDNYVPVDSLRRHPLQLSRSSGRWNADRAGYSSGCGRARSPDRLREPDHHAAGAGRRA